jgi:AraC-like DNA-binding protein
MADHPYRQALAAPARPAAVRDAMDMIEAGPHLPLTTSTLAKQCHVSVRTLQQGFQRHLSMSPMADVRVVRLRRAHRDPRSADPPTAPSPPSRTAGGSPTSDGSPPPTKRRTAKHRSKPCALPAELTNTGGLYGSPMPQSGDNVRRARIILQITRICRPSEERRQRTA